MVATFRRGSVQGKHRAQLDTAAVVEGSKTKTKVSCRVKFCFALGGAVFGINELPMELEFFGVHGASQPYDLQSAFCLPADSQRSPASVTK